MLREVPEGWRTVDLSDVTKESRVRNSELNISEDRLVGVFKDQGMVPMRDRVRGASVERCKVVRPGDFAYNPMRINIGSIARSTADANLMVSPDYVVFSPDTNKIDGAFLDYLRKSDAWSAFVGNAGDGGVRIRIYFEHLARFQFNLPPLHEQRRIAEILSSVDETIAATRAVIEQTRKVKQGVLERLLTKGIGHTRFKQTEIGEIPEAWELKRLRDLAIHITSGSRGWAQYYSDEGELFLRSQNVRNGSLDLSDKQFVTVPTSAEGSRTLVKAEDLVFTITGNSVGNIARIPADLGNAYVSQHVALVRLRDKQLSAFLEAFFSPSGPGNHQVLNAQYGQSKPGLSLENVRSFHVLVPPHDELAHLSEIVEHYSVCEMSVAKELSHLISLKSALMSDLLTGRKRVTDALPMAAE